MHFWPTVNSFILFHISQKFQAEGPSNNRLLWVLMIAFPMQWLVAYNLHKIFMRDILVYDIFDICIYAKWVYVDYKIV